MEVNIRGTHSLRTLIGITSTEENNILVVDDNHAMTGQWNGELVHGGPDTVIPNLGGTYIIIDDLNLFINNLCVFRLLI